MVKEKNSFQALYFRRGYPLIVAWWADNRSGVYCC